MSDLLHNLENNEAVLLMYLAGELPDAERAEVRQMLAGDPALRAELADLTALHDHVAGALSQDDALAGLPSRADHATRFVSRAVATREPTPAVTPAVAADAHRLRIGWWAYPVAAAALVLIGVFLFRAGQPHGVGPANKQFVQATTASPDLDAPPEILRPAVPDDSLADLEKEAKEMLSLRTGGGSFFGSPDSVDLEH